MTTPSYPFLPTIQSTTTIYLPHDKKAIDVLPPYHGYAFQEKDLEHGILRPHDVYSGDALHQEYARLAKRAEEKAAGRGGVAQQLEGASFLSCPSDHSEEIPTVAGMRPLREGSDDVYSKESGGQSQHPESTWHRKHVHPVWKAKTRIPQSTLLLGTVASFRPTVAQHHAGLALHRHQRHQRYPAMNQVDDEEEAEVPRASSSTSGASRHANDATSKPLEEGQMEWVEKALAALDPPEVFARRLLAQDRGGCESAPPLGQQTIPTAHLEMTADHSSRSPMLPSVSTSFMTSGEDPNAAAIKKLFKSMRGRSVEGKQDEGDSETCDEGEQEEGDDENQQVVSQQEPSGVSTQEAQHTAAHPLALAPPHLPPSNGVCPAGNQNTQQKQPLRLAPAPPPRRLPPSSSEMVVPHGVVNAAVEAVLAGTSMDQETTRHMRWLMYEEMYELSLLGTEERETNPIPYYGSFVGQTTDAALKERQRHPLELHSMDQAHQRIHHLLDGLTASDPSSSSSVTEQTPVKVHSALDDVWKEVVECKTTMFNDYVKHFTDFSERLALIREEKEERLALLGLFVSCKYPEPCRCLKWDMEILNDLSGVALEPAVPLPCVMVSAVLSLSHTLQASLLAERAAELEHMKNLSDCMYTSMFVRQCFVEDERRQFAKLLFYHQYCLQLGSRYDPSAAEWCRLRGLDTIDEPAEEEEEESAGDDYQGSTDQLEQDQDDDGRPTQQEGDEVVVEVVPPTPLPAEVPSDTVPKQKPRRAFPLDYKQMRRSRLQFLGPDDSPYCSYAKFLEVIITSVVEKEGRAAVVNAQKEARSAIEEEFAASYETCVLHTMEREGREAMGVDEVFEMEALHRERLTWEADAPFQHLYMMERETRIARLAVEVREAEMAAVAGVAEITEECTKEFRELWRAIHNQLLVLQRKGLTRLRERQLVKEWAMEEPVARLGNDESRHRMTVMRWEMQEREPINHQFLWLRDTYMSARAEFERLEEAAREHLSTFMDETDARRDIERTYARQRRALFEPVFCSAEPDSHHLRRHDEFDLRRSVVHDLCKFISTDLVAEVFSC